GLWGQPKLFVWTPGRISVRILLTNWGSSHNLHANFTFALLEGPLINRLFVRERKRAGRDGGGLHNRARGLAKGQEQVPDRLQSVDFGYVDVHEEAVLACDPVAFDNLGCALCELCDLPDEAGCGADPYVRRNGEAQRLWGDVHPVTGDPPPFLQPAHPLGHRR